MFKCVNGENIPLSDEEKAEILAEWAKNEEETKRTVYIDQRRSEYPPVDECIDAIFKQLDLFDKKDPEYEKVSKLRQGIKAKYPKPN